MEYIRRLFLYHKGFSLAELVIYLGILGLSVGVFTSVLDTVTKTQVEQSTQNEISGQLTFSMQTIQRLIKTSSVIDLEAGVATSTLVLQMPQQAVSPTTVYLENGTIYITQGENAPVQALTSGSVTVDSLEFRKSSQPGAKDVVQIDIAISQFEPSQGDLVTRSLRSAVSRVSAVTFDSHLLPPTDGQYDVGSATLRWRDGYFSGKLSPGEICFGGDCKSSWGAITGVSGTGSSNYLAKWQTSGTITSSIITDNGTDVGIGVLNPSAKFHVSKGSSGTVAMFTADSGNYLTLGNDTSGQWIEARGVDTAHRKMRIQVFDGTSYYQQLFIDAANQRIYTPSGIVGIGTASPDTNYKLTLTGGGIKSENTSSQPAGYFSSTGGGKAIQTGSGSILFGSLAGSGTRSLVVDATGLVSATSTSSGTISGSGVSGYLPIWSGSTSLATSTVYETGGKIGIGITSPQSNFQIGGNPFTSATFSVKSTSGSGVVSETNSNWAGVFKHTTSGHEIDIGGSTYGLIVKTGNVGIGTTGPSYDLDVVSLSDDNVIRSRSNSGLGGVYVEGTARAEILLADNGAGVDQKRKLIASDDGSLRLGKTNDAWSTNTWQLTIANDGKVGIGNISPAYTLDVTGDARFTQPVVVGTPTLDTHATTKSYVDSAVSSGVGSGVSGTTNYISKFTSSNVVGNSSIYETGGNIGIGTTGATNKLTVSGDTGLRIIRTSNSDQVLTLTGGDGSGNAGIVASYSLLLNANKDAGLGGNINFQSAGSSKMYIASSGNVGIGTTAPAQLLHVAGTARIDSTLYLNNNAHYINAGEFYVNRTTAQGGFTFNNVGVGELIFKTSNTERARINSVGNVGIGTTNPGYKLDVSGTGNFTQPVIVGTPTANDHAATKSYVDSAAVGQSGWTDGGSNVYLTTTSDNVGIGTSSPGSKLQIVGGGNNGSGILSINSSDAGSDGTLIRLSSYSFINQDSSGNSYWSWGHRYDGTNNTWVRTYSGAGLTQAKLGYGASQGFEILTDTSTTSDPPALTSRFIVRNDGNVGIGTTSPVEKLDINGNIKVGSGNIYSGSTLNLYPSTGGVALQAQSDNVRISTGHNFYVVDGVVGIGTTSPLYTLHVSGTGSFSQPVIVGTPTAATHATTKSYVDSAVSSGVSGGISGTQNYIAKFTGTNTVGNSVIYENSGVIGINTTSPYTINSTRFDVRGSLFAGGPIIFSQADENSNVDHIWYNDNATAYGGSAGVYHFEADAAYQSGVANGTVNIGNVWATNSGYTNYFAGNVGIATSTPQTKLHIYNSTTGNSNGTGIYLDRAGTNTEVALNWLTAGTKKWFLGLDNDLSDNLTLYKWDGTGSGFVQTWKDGNVGIGTQSPSYKLDVSGTGQFTQPVIVGTPTANNHAATKSYVDSATVGQTGWTDGGSNVYLTTSTDSVGIGTNSPTARLDINNSSTNTALNINMSGSTGAVTDTTYGTYVINNRGGGNNGPYRYGGYFEAQSYTSSANYNYGITGVGNKVGGYGYSATGVLGIGRHTYLSYSSGSTNLIGVQGQVDFNDDGIAFSDSGYGASLYTSAHIPANKTLTTYYGLYMSPPTGSGTITNRYGIYQNDSSGINYFSGNVGIGTTNPVSKLTVAGGSANWNETNPGVSVGSIHLNPQNSTDHYGSAITFGASDTGSGQTAQAGIYVRSDGSYGTKMYFGTTSSYSSGSYTRLLIDWNGNIGVNTISPSYKFTVNGTGSFTQPVIVGTPTANDHAATKSYVDSAITTGTGSYVLKAGDTMTGTLAFAAGSADRLNLNGNNIVGVNKLTVTTIDPVYEINNKKYATYVSDTIGLKMEHYGKITTRTKERSSYVSIIDFSKEKEGSDLWLFWQTIDEGDNMKDIILTMTPESNVDSWYNIIPEKKQIKIFTSSPTTLSYHLVAPRHDSDTWPTHLPADHKEKGTRLEIK